MEDRITFLQDSSRLLPPAGIERREGALELVVLHSNPRLTARALKAALKLAEGFQAAVTLVAVHVLPYPSPLECQEGLRQCLEAELTAVARAARTPVRARLVFARDREQTYLRLLPNESLAVIGTRDRWWRTREERLARKLAANGHSVAVIKVK